MVGGSNPFPGHDTVSPVSGILQYRAVDDRGEEILDALEEHWGAKRIEGEESTREFWVPAAGTVDLDPNLDAIDPAWSEHIERLTAY
jgi:hypothetical protein